MKWGHFAGPHNSKGPVEGKGSAWVRVGGLVGMVRVKDIRGCVCVSVRTSDVSKS